MSLMNLTIKHKDMVILGHEDDRPNTENCNLHLHDYTALGLKLRSIQSMYFSTFLSYKPEHMLLGHTDDDLEIALLAVSKDGSSLSDFAVFIEDKKFAYLTNEKQGKLSRAGLTELNKEELEAAIHFKLRSSYLYGLDWRNIPPSADSVGYKGSYFNIMVEFPREGGEPERVTVALEYMPAQKVLRVVTLT
jgi:hypothetical protein